MNSVLNNDSEQCPESKLGWVHQVDTLNPAYAHRPRALCPGRPCRGPVPDHIVAYGRSCHRPGRPCCRLGWLCRNLYRDIPSTKVMRACRVVHCRMCRSTPASCRRALRAVSQPLAALHRDTRSPPSQPRYNYYIATQLSAARTARRIVGHLAVSWPSSGRVMAC